MQRLLQKIADVAAHRRSTRLHVGTAELRLGLRFKNRLHHLHRNRRDDAGAHVRGIELLLIVAADDLHDGLSESALVRAAHRGVLTVHKAEEILARFIAVRKGDFNIRAAEVNDRIERRYAEVLLEQILEPVLRAELGAVEIQRQACVQIGIEAEHARENFLIEPKLCAEDRIVRLERQARTVGVGAFLRLLHFIDHLAFAELDGLRFAISVRLDFEEPAQRIHRLDTHTVEADGFLEGFAVIFRSRVDLRRAVHQLAQRNAPAVVAHGHGVVLIQFDVDLLSVAHDELINGVVYGLLDEEVDAVIRL